MTPDQIPQEWVDILDARAGKEHSRRGPVMAALAEILTVALASQAEYLQRRLDSRSRDLGQLTQTSMSKIKELEGLIAQHERRTSA